jgi:MHS family shikimate/dehydroshikimate transporter-like MFS transporter
MLTMIIMGSGTLLIGCQVSAALSGGLAPIIATALLAWGGATWPVSLYLMALGVVVAVAVIAAQETHTAGIDEA